MDLAKLVKSIDTETARAFVTAARSVIDALLIEGERIEQTHTPETRDYESATLSRETPPDGWLSHAELRETARRMAEAVAAEKWTEGVVCTIQLLTRLGAL